MRKIAKVSWRSPSNIAFIKYWGKRGIQLPQNPSLSLSLNKCFTETSLALYEKETKAPLEFSFLFEGKENTMFSERISRYLEDLYDYLSFLPHYKLVIESSNSFPHSAGIASSASAMSALALCLGTTEERLTKKTNIDFYQHVSELARLGSGSASRSLFGEYAIWGRTDDVKGSSDKYAIEVKNDFHIDFKCLRDVILIVDKGQKKVSSSVGHGLMDNHPYAEKRFLGAKKNLKNLLAAMRAGDFESFAWILEHEALSLHAMMMTAQPWFTLLSPNSLIIIEKIKQFREETKAKICFTIDAGPNIHVIFPAEEENKIQAFIEKELVPLCANNSYIVDSIGQGPEILEDEFT